MASSNIVKAWDRGYGPKAPLHRYDKGARTQGSDGWQCHCPCILCPMSIAAIECKSRPTW